MNAEDRLVEIIEEAAPLRELEPQLYSVIDEGDAAPYDKWGGVYEAVACNKIYNRIIWGYWTGEFGKLCTDALKSDSGWVLDVGCGSLAFTAREHLLNKERPVILSDRSIWMLRAAKKRIERLNGSVPGNVVFLHADAMKMPVKTGTVQTVIAMNILHAVEDGGEVVRELKRVCSGDGSISITTLIKSNRFADAYMHKLAEGGAMFEREMGQLLALVAEQEQCNCLNRGSVAFINIGKELEYFAKHGRQCR